MRDLIEDIEAIEAIQDIGVWYRGPHPGTESRTAAEALRRVADVLASRGLIELPPLVGRDEVTPTAT